MFKNQKGITLVALSITIIVLLILSGITIANLSQNNGVIKETKSAAKLQNQVNAKEEIELAWASAIKELETASDNDDKPQILEKYLNKIKTDSAIVGVIINTSDGNLQVTYGIDGENYIFEINSRGKAYLIEN